MSSKDPQKKDIEVQQRSGSIALDEVISFKGEGVEWCLIPTQDMSSDLLFFAKAFHLSPERSGHAQNDPFLDEYAILRAPNGFVFELVKPKRECAELFNHPVFCFTVADLFEKEKLLKSIGIQMVSDIIDTKAGWGWFYIRNPSGILLQVQGPLPQPTS